MSHEATNWAVKQRGIKPAAKIVLWQLCDRFHRDNGCFPSQGQLAEDCEMSRSSLNDQLAELEEARLIVRERRKDHRQRHESTRYRFAFEDGFPFATEDAEPAEEPCPEIGHGAVSEIDPEPCPNFTASRVRNSETNLVREPGREPFERDARERAILPDAGEAKRKIPQRDLLDQVRREHPKAAHADQVDVEASWLRLTPEERQAAADDIGRWLASKGGKHVLGLAKYLGQKLWTLLPAPIEKPAASEAAPARVFVAMGSAAWRAWEAARGRKLPTMTGEGGKAGWWFPSEMPPSAERDSSKMSSGDGLSR